MAWTRIDDGFADHPKVIGLSDAAFRLHVHALCYAARTLTDGLVPHGWLTGGKGRRVPKAVTELVAARLWEEALPDYRIHDYLKYQPSRADAEGKRQEAADRMKRAREVRANNLRSSQEVRSTPSHPIPSQRARATPSLVRPRDPNAFAEGPIFSIPQKWAEKALKASNGTMVEADLDRFAKAIFAKVEREQIDLSRVNLLAFLDQQLMAWREATGADGRAARLVANTNAHLAKVAAMERGE